MNRFAICNIIFVSLLLISGCATIRGDWKSASQENTIDAYASFIRAHPDAVFVKDAQNNIEQLKHEEAVLRLGQGSQKEMKAYLEEYPSGRYSVEAEKMIEQNVFEKAQDSIGRGSQNEMKAYLKEYPSGKYSVEALSILEGLAFEEAEKVETKEAYEMFLKEYPSGKHFAEAEVRLRKIRFESVLKENTVAAYEEFVRQYPDGVDSVELQKDLPKMRRWEQAKRLGETAVRMAPVASISYRVIPVTNQAISNGFSVEQPDTLKEDLVTFKELLDAGANPNFIRIKGYVPPSRKGVFVNFGSPGEVVSAQEGGMTLLEYCTTIKQNEAVKILKNHRGR